MKRVRCVESVEEEEVLGKEIEKDVEKNKPSEEELLKVIRYLVAAGCDVNFPVTSPVVSWAIVRHSYVIRVSCLISTKVSRADVIDVNFNNVLSFGFGANAGLGPSCLSLKPEENSTANFLRKQNDSTVPSTFVTVVKYLGWLVLVVDVIFLLFSVNLLFQLYKGRDKRASNWFLISAAVSIGFSFLYGMLYVSACVTAGGPFPVFEFIFTIIDLGVWIYFLIVVQSYRRTVGTNLPSNLQR